MSFLLPEAPLAHSTVASTDLGASLDQLTDGIWHPLDFHSRKLTPAEKKTIALMTGSCWRFMML